MGEFAYGWGNDYAGNTVSNLDVTLRTLQSKAPKAKVIVVMQPSEAPHIGKLLDVFSVHAVLKYPVSEEEMRVVLRALRKAVAFDIENRLESPSGLIKALRRQSASAAVTE